MYGYGNCRGKNMNGGNEDMQQDVLANSEGENGTLPTLNIVGMGNADLS